MYPEPRIGAPQIAQKIVIEPILCLFDFSQQLTPCAVLRCRRPKIYNKCLLLFHGLLIRRKFNTCQAFTESFTIYEHTISQLHVVICVSYWLLEYKFRSDTQRVIPVATLRYLEEELEMPISVGYDSNCFCPSSDHFLNHLDEMRHYYCE